MLCRPDRNSESQLARNLEGEVGRAKCLKSYAAKKSLHSVQVVSKEVLAVT